MFDNDLFVINDTPADEFSASQWNVMVVDDDMDIHVVTRFCLADTVIGNRRLNLIDAYSGQEAIKQLKDNDSIDLILLDVVMETQNAGLDVARWLRENPQRASTPKIILRTGQPGKYNIGDIANNGLVDAVLQKSSITYASLVMTISEMLLGPSPAAGMN